MVTDPPTNTDRTDYNTLHHSLAQSAIIILCSAEIHYQEVRVCVFVCSISGTVAVIVTCPLEVVKTRFQSSVYTSLIRTVSYMPQCAYSAPVVPATSWLAYELPSKTSRTLHSFLHKSPSGGFSQICWFIGSVILYSILCFSYSG